MNTFRSIHDEDQSSCLHQFERSWYGLVIHFVSSQRILVVCM